MRPSSASRSKLSFADLEARRDRPEQAPLVLVLAILVHAALGGILHFWGKPWPLVSPSDSISQIPIEFVETGADRQPEAPPEDTQRIANQDSRASEVVQPDQPLSGEAARSGAETALAESSATSGSDSDQTFSDSFAENLAENFAEDLGEDTAPAPPTGNSNSQGTAAPVPTFPKPPHPQGSDSSSSSPDPESQSPLAANPNSNPPVATPRSSTSRNSVPSASSNSPFTGQRPDSSITASSALEGSTGLQSEGTLNSDRQDSGSGVDAQQDVDLGPYLARVRYLVENQWLPGVSNTSSQVVVNFSISQGGDLINPYVAASSGSSSVDEAALSAVERAAYGFGPLPAGYAEDTVDIAFTFTVTITGWSVN